MKIFNLDSPFMRFLTLLANLMILNIVCMICCLPIVTVGASITAMYYVTLKMVRGEDPYIIKSFFKSFKSNFRQATIIWVIEVVVILLLVMDFRIVYMVMSGGFASFMKGALIVLTVLLVLTALYVYPVLSRFDNTVLRTIRNAFLMSLLNLPKSIMIVLIHLAPILLLFSRSLAVLSFIFGLSAVAYICSMLYVRIFKRYEPEVEDDGSDGELKPLSFIVEEEEARAREEAAAKELAEKELTEKESETEETATEEAAVAEEPAEETAMEETAVAEEPAAESKC